MNACVRETTLMKKDHNVLHMKRKKNKTKVVIVSQWWFNGQRKIMYDVDHNDNLWEDKKEGVYRRKDMGDKFYFFNSYVLDRV